MPVNSIPSADKPHEPHFTVPSQVCWKTRPVRSLVIVCGVAAWYSCQACPNTLRTNTCLSKNTISSSPDTLKHICPTPWGPHMLLYKKSVPKEHMRSDPASASACHFSTTASASHPTTASSHYMTFPQGGGTWKHAPSASAKAAMAAQAMRPEGCGRPCWAAQPTRTAPAGSSRTALTHRGAVRGASTCKCRTLSRSWSAVRSTSTCSRSKLSRSWKVLRVHYISQEFSIRCLLPEEVRCGEVHVSCSCNSPTMQLPRWCLRE